MASINQYNLEYHTWYNSMGGWALTVELISKSPSSSTIIKWFINNSQKVKALICPYNQIEDIVSSDTPFYFSKWGDLDRAIKILENYKQLIIQECLNEYCNVE